MLVDCGDFAGQSAHEQVKTPFFFDMLDLLGYDAITIGEREFNFGYQYLKDVVDSHDLNVVSANIRDKESGKRVWKEYVIVKKQGLKVAITGFLNPNIALRAGADSVIIDDPLAVAQKLIPELRRKADVVVVLAHTGRVEAYDLASQVKGIDVMVIGHRPSLVLASRDLNGTIAVSSGTQGQNIGETLLYMDGRNIEKRDGRVVILLPKVGERADIAKLQKDFEDQLNERLRIQQQRDAVAASALGPGAPHYLGMKACITCHQPQYDHWQTTPHARAFETLKKQSKEATPDCVKCHVTGWTEPGGYQNQVATSQMTDVQCEACHGMGTEHNQFDEAFGPPKEELCITCHTPENDPSWNYAAKLPMVAH